MKRVLAFLLSAIPLLALAQPITAEQKAEVLKGIEDIVLKRAFIPGVDFSKWPEFLAKQQEAIDAATEIPAFTGAVNRALREFGASHISLRTPRAAAARTQTTTVGIGVAVRKDGENFVVRTVADAGPAKALGIAPGDVIVEIDGKPMTAPEQLEGDEGTKVELTLKKEDGANVKVTVERKRYSTVRPETLTWIDEETAMLKVYTFSTGYGRQNIEKLMTEAAKAKKLILDLRNNGGGAVNNLNHLLSLLLPPDTAVGTFVSRGTADKFKAEKPDGDVNDVKQIAEWAPDKMKTRKQKVEPFKGKIAVLINRGSASASEICAAALRDAGGAILIGTQTAGAVLGSVFGRLPHGFQLQYPVNDYVTIKGQRLERNPVKPDTEVTAREPEEVVKKAVELLAGKH